LAPLTWDPRVAAVAEGHSRDMVDRSYFSHVSPDGETPWDRLAAAGISYSAAGENIAYGYPTGSAVLAAWLGSPGHRANIENPSFTRHGVGLVGTYWTHVFIRPVSMSAGR
ncbi:MAG TPA: CAP domain-containing protein, partial [Candidatus Eisenbacteria bacterium]